MENFIRNNGFSSVQSLFENCILFLSLGCCVYETCNERGYKPDLTHPIIQRSPNVVQSKVLTSCKFI